MSKENEFYYIMLLVGAILAIGIWLFNVRKNLLKKDYRALFVFSITLPIAIFLSFITSYMLNTDLQSFPIYELVTIIGKEYFITLFYFSVLSSAIFWIFNLKISDFNAAAQSLALFSIIARIGCLIAGCCDGINNIAIRELEIIFGVFAFVYLQFFCRKSAFLKYVTAYSIFRLITQFYRIKPAPYYIVQIYATIIIGFVIVNYFINKKNIH